MTDKSPSHIDMVLERARADSMRPPPRDRTGSVSRDEQGEFAGYAVRPNRPATRRKVSTFAVILFLFALGTFSILYVSNIIAVNQLASDINALQTKYANVVNTNESLRAEIHRKSSWDRIGPIATNELHLRLPDPSEPAGTVSIDGDRVDEIARDVRPTP